MTITQTTRATAKGHRTAGLDLSQPVMYYGDRITGPNATGVRFERIEAGRSSVYGVKADGSKTSLGGFATRFWLAPIIMVEAHDIEEAHAAALAEDTERTEQATADQQITTVNPLCARVDKHDRHDVYVRGLDGAWSYQGTCEGRRIVDDRIILTRVSPDEYRHEATGVRVFRYGSWRVWHVQAPGQMPRTGGNADRAIDNVMLYAHTVIRRVQRQQAAS